MPRGRPRKKRTDVLLKSAELLGWALGGLEREIALTRDRLTSLTAQAVRLRKRLGGPRAAAATAAGEPRAKGPRRRKKMSPEARKRISEMMKKRWAERRRRGA